MRHKHESLVIKLYIKLVQMKPNKRGKKTHTQNRPSSCRSSSAQIQSWNNSARIQKKKKKNWAEGLQSSAIISSAGSNSCLDQGNNHKHTHSQQEKKVRKRFEALQMSHKSPSNKIGHCHHTQVSTGCAQMRDVYLIN